MVAETVIRSAEMKINKVYFVVATLFTLLAVVAAAKAALDVSSGTQVDYATASTGGAGAGGGGCGGSGGGGCGGGSGGGGCGSGGAPKDPKELKKIEKQAVDYYISKYNDKAVKADVLDKGCHVEIVIYKGEKAVMYLSYRNGQLQESS